MSLLTMFRNVGRMVVTGRDNKTHDVARWSWIVTLLATIAGAAWNAFQAGILNLSEFAQAVGIITGAHGAAVLMKKEAEPPASRDDQS